MFFLFFVGVSASSPHAEEPPYSIAAESVISLSSAIDKSKIQSQKEEITALHTAQKTLTQRALRCISAAGSLLAENQRLVLSCTDTAMVRDYAYTLSGRYLPPACQPSHEKARLLSICTLHGDPFLKSTAFSLADQFVALNDPYGTVGRILLSALREQALAKGHSVITCYCPMHPYDKIDHLFIPALRLCFTTCNSYHAIPSEPIQSIPFTRFCNTRGLDVRRQRLCFNQNAAAELLVQAFALQSKIQACCNRLEEYSMQASDFSFLDNAYRQILSFL